MNRTLIAIATAGLLTSGAVVAGQTNMYAPEADHHDLVAVQYGYDRSDERSGNINEREARIKDRIQRGMHDGTLTDREARRLYGELRDIEGKERAFRSDGRLDGREAAQLNRDLDRLADDVRDQRQDEQRRYEQRRY